MEDFYARLRRTGQGPRLDWGGWELDTPQQGGGTMPYEPTGMVPYTTPQAGGPWQAASSTPGWTPPMYSARTATPDPSGNLPGTAGYVSPDTSVTTSVPKGPGVGVGALGPLITGGGRTGTGQSGQGQVAGAGVAGTFNGAPTPGVGDTTVLTLAGQLPGGGATTWTQQPEWMDGAYNLGHDWNGSQHIPRNQTYDKGFIVGSDVGWGSGMALPVAYNAAQDNYAGGLGGTETAIHKAIRIANDLVKNGQAKSPQRALEYGMAFVQAEARRAGVSTGWDMGQLADQLGGYDESKSYFTAQAGQGQPGATGSGPTAPPAAPPAGQEAPPVVSPLNSQGQPGQASGAPTGPQLGGGTGTADPLYNEALASNKALRTAALLDRLGIGSPMARRNMFTGGVGQRLAEIMDPWVQTQGMQGGDPLANYSGLIDKLVGHFSSGGGGMGAVAGDARNAAQLAVGDPRYNTMPDEELISMLTGFNQLANLPQNAWLQRAYGNLQDEMVAQYASFNNQPGKLGSTDILGFIKDNPLFGFMTGQQGR